jgi:hypothetical protein
LTSGSPPVEPDPPEPETNLTAPTVNKPTTNDGNRITDLTPIFSATRSIEFDRWNYRLFPLTATSASTGYFYNLEGTTGITGTYLVTTPSYAGATALQWNTGYKIAFRVSEDNGTTWSNWSALHTFYTDLASTPTLTSIAGEAQVDTPWIIDATPTFVVTRGGSDTIDKVEVRVLNEANTVQIWASGLVDVANAITGSITYSGPALVPGTSYLWTARIQDAVGPISAEATKVPFRLNAPPSIPVEVFPPANHVYRSTDEKLFRAKFSDKDMTVMGDAPTQWDIIVQYVNGDAFDTMIVTTGLEAGMNEVEWNETAFADDVDYRWRSRFYDIPGEAGAYSAWNTFRISVPPDGDILTPSNGSTVSTTSPFIDWSYTGGTQRAYRISIDETDENGVFIRNTWAGVWKVGEATSYQLPPYYLKGFKYYNITLLVENEDLLQDPTPSTVNVVVLLEAPDPVTGLSVTTFPSRSLTQLEWDVNVMPTGQHHFVAYTIYKRLPNDEDWQYVGQQTNRTRPIYNDYYAGNGITYQYRVVAVATKEGISIEMESPDDDDGGNIASSTLDSDVWMLIGKDRDSSHISELFVDKESHNRPVQQEEFETLGSDRKVIIRGFVLGHEGSISTIWTNEDHVALDDEQSVYNHTIIGRRIVDYLTREPGPHILKSPFGDVWDVTFSAPDYEWQPGGHLYVELTWIEVGQTSLVSI